MKKKQNKPSAGLLGFLFGNRNYLENLYSNKYLKKLELAFLRDKDNV